MATVSVTSWAEFVAAVGTSGNVVECPQNAVWDLNDISPEHLDTLEINCAEIHGNGLIIRNMNFSEPDVTSTTGVYTDWRFAIRINCGVKVSNLHLHNVTCMGFMRSTFIPVSGVGYSEFTGCTFTVVSKGGFIGVYMSDQPTFTECTIVAQCKRYFQNGQMCVWNYCDIFYRGAEFSDSEHGAYTELRANNSRIRGILGGEIALTEYVQNTVIDGTVEKVTGGSTNAHGLVVNSDKAENIGEFFTGLTTEELADLSTIQALGLTDGWYIDENGVPAHERFLPMPKFAEKPYPLGGWQIDPAVNNGFPFNALIPDLEYIQIADPVDENPYITIYDKRTKQDEFDNNGIILCPTSCIVTETINDKWALDLIHPVDPDGKWRYIEPSAIVKALGQLFTLRKIQHSWRGNSGNVQAAADHIFYQMLDGWVYPGARITGQTGLDVLHAVDTYTDRFPGENQTMYYWTYDSDLTVPVGVDYSKWCPTTEGATPLEFVMGRDGLLAMCGGELYRDNFYYSVKQRMENAEDNVFEIRVGKNLKGITRIVDFSQFCVHFTGYDQYGQWISVSWTDEYAYQFVPHTIIRSKNFNIYVDPSTLPEDADENAIYERSYEMLEAEVMAFFNANCAPVVSFKVDIEDVKDNPDFKMFVNPDKLKVGNTGRLYDERLGVDMGLKISQTKTDAITGKVIEVTFGTVQSFTGGQTYPAVLTDLIPVPQGGEMPLRDKNGEALYDKDGEALMERIVI